MSEDQVELVRPSEHATDREWAEAVTFEKWELEERLWAVEGFLEDIQRAMIRWKPDLAETVASRESQT